MQDFLLSSLIIVGLTLLLVSGVRKLFAKADGEHRLDGKWLVFLCATAVGVGLSFAAMYLEKAIAPATIVLAWWVLVVRGAAAAATAFGYANWRQWATAQLPAVSVDARSTINNAGATPEEAAPPSTPTVPDLILPPPPKAPT